MHRTNQRGSLPSILRPADIPPAPPSVGNSPGRSLVQAQSTRAPMPNDAELGHSWSPPSALFSAGVSPSRTFSGNAKAGTSTRLGATHSADVMDGDRTIGVSPARSTLLSPMSTMNSSMASRATAKAARAAAELNQEGSSSSYHNKFLFGDRGAQPWNDRLQNSPTRSSPPSLNEEDEADALMGVVKNIVTRKGRRIFEMETVLARNNTRTAAADPNQRIAVANKTTDELAQLYPALATILQHLQRLTGDLGEALNQTKVNAGTALQAKEAELIQRFESFFEKKLSLLLREKKQVDGRCKELETQLYQLREERDKDLMDAKKVVMSRLNDTEKKEDELRYFRQLIASVFQTNAQLTNRIFDLETLLKVNRIELPPAPSELYQFRSQGMSEAKSAGLTDAAEESSRRLAKLSNTRHISEQVSPEFIAASKEEMNHARLTLQNELLHCAFDDRSAYRLQVKGLRMENIELKYRVSQLEEKVSELNQYIHEHRFVAAYDETDAPLTPRPRDVPFEIQSELGIDFKHSTAHIMAELAAVAINQKHQFSSVLLRLRQMTTVSEWMQEETLLELTEDRNEVGVLPTFPLNSWPTIPHFLRTNITPDVSNLRWSQADAAAVMLEFFKQYRTLRKSCRYIRDNKMVAPRQYQLFERRETILARLDATKEEVELSEDNVPFGYIVSQYINDYLMEYQLPGTNVAVTLPGTLHSHFTLRRHERVVEMEFTRFAYNLWWAAQRYRHTQPLCRLFLDVLNGRLPIGIFEQMEQSMEFVRICISRLDSDGSHTFTYPRLVNGIIKMTADLDAQATRCGILAVAQTFEENEASFLGGRVRLEALMADESFCLDVAKGGESIRATNNNNLPPRITARLIAGRCTQPPGASVFHRYWRRLIMVRFEKVYNMVERVLAPLVVESEVVLGLYLLPVPEALLRVRAFNANPSLLNQENLAAALGKLPLFPEDAALDPEAANDPENPDKKSAPGMPDVTANYQELLEERREVINSRRVAEGTRVETVVNGLLSVLPRLNRAVHFPFSRPPGGQEPSVSNADGVSDGGSVARRTENRTPSGAAGSHAEGPRQLTTAGSTNSLHQSIIASKRQGEKKRTAARRRKSRKGMEHVALPEEMMVQSDKEMVEWFGFCYALRQHLPTFGESLFQPPIAATALNLLSMSASITSTLLDEMAPPDPINGLHKDNDGDGTLKILSSGEHEITSIKKDHSYNI